MPVIMDCLKNIAGHNICEYLRSAYKLDNQIVTADANVLDFTFDKDTDLIIVPSTHRSEMNRRTLTVHIPGNWSKADFGGKPFTLNMGYGSKMKSLLMIINELANTKGLAHKYEVSLEVDHHGPTLDSPILFVEIGCTEKEWGDKEAISIIGDSIVKLLDDSSHYENRIGYGGGHYAPHFTKYELDTNGSAYAHLCPKYRFEEINYDMFVQAIEKSVEPVAKIEMEKKGLLSTQKSTLKDWCEKYGIEHKII